ncbi:hypothetical protein IPH67_01255 [bacterium]|nr:MAG: hypothetical protein IPH67_01255 [bacterium]
MFQSHLKIQQGTEHQLTQYKENMLINNNHAILFDFYQKNDYGHNVVILNNHHDLLTDLHVHWGLKKICDSTPYMLKTLSLTKKGKQQEKLSSVVFLVASSWPNIHFVEQGALGLLQNEPVTSRARGLVSSIQKRLLSSKGLKEQVQKRCTLKNAYLLAVGQDDEENQYIIYAHVEKNNKGHGPKNVISTFRKLRASYSTFTIKKWIITKDQSFADLVTFVERENNHADNADEAENERQSMLQDSTIEQEELQTKNPTTLCTIENVPVDGLHVPFIIDYRDDDHWAVVCKKKDAFYLKTNNHSEIGLSFMRGQKFSNPAILAIRYGIEDVTFYCKDSFGQITSDELELKKPVLLSLNNYTVSVDSQNNTKSSLVGCFVDQKNIYLLLAERFKSFIDHVRYGIRALILQKVSKQWV